MIGQHLLVARALGFGLTLAVALSGALGCSPASSQADTVVVARQDLLLEVDVSGALKAIDSDTLAPPAIPGVWQFKISMMAPEGAEVKQGDPVLGFDVTDLQRQLERKQAERDTAATQAEASRAEARIGSFDSKLEIADAEAKRRKAGIQADVPEGIVAVDELAKARLDLEIAEQRVGHLSAKDRDAQRRRQANIERWEHQHQRAEASVEQLTAAIEKMSIKASRDGTVIYETNWRGEKKSVGDSVWRAGSVMQIVSLEAMEGMGEVDEVDSSRIEAGQSVSLHLDAQPDVVLHGKIASVSTMVRRQSPENPLKVVELRIELEPNDKLRLRPGMRFRGKVLTQKIEGALVVPLDAIVPTAEGPMARKRTSSGVELVPVQTGRRSETLVEITGGLELGDELARSTEAKP
ncbi:Macrolide-specific efflux protein macA precursor [Enhygromyxa salina]|uniref:Macrolide-specific efflux protein macA n=1 Tax=Enhygromyxa salina TaxID=215803 RepID=A0A0C2D3Y3_9BACT|nr:efflux RND transporter periplasmic adaptor subunit [Enhygromyxa salina]KIG17926.1 Macrolide-specific efflux protein macA precursor [Enhygromyxa salina]